MTLKAFLITIFSFCSVYSISAQKFEPKDGNCLVFIGQDLEATGGFDEYKNGYVDFFETPAGITLYTNLAPGNESFGYYNKGLDGLKTKANWGAGDSWGNLYLQDKTYQYSAISIGLSFVNHEKNISKGKLDALIKDLAKWIKSSNRPVFLRIGYEFDGWSWNHYKKKHYLNVWKRIHKIFENLKVDNVAFVWQSKGTSSDQKTLEDWYPGNDLVDWCGYSYFGQPDKEMIVFARKHNKPVFIAEATPVRQIDNLYFNSDLKNTKLEKTIWREWFVPFFKLIHENSDVIKAFSYINADWASQPMWVSNPTFNQVDSRLQMSKWVSLKWKKEIEKPQYINATDTIWPSLNK